MQSLLFGVEATDPLTFGAIVVLLALMALAATYVPARRAARIDPLVSLRGERAAPGTLESISASSARALLVLGPVVPGLGVARNRRRRWRRWSRRRRSMSGWSR